ILVQIFYDNISLDNRVKLDQFTQFRFSSLTKEEGWIQIEEYIQYQEDLWDDLSLSMNVSSILEAMQPTIRGHLKRACNQITYLKTPIREVGLKNPYVICDYCEGSHEADECGQNNPAEQVCLSGGDIYDDPSLPRRKFKDELTNFMLEKKSHTKGIGDMIGRHHKEMHEQFSQILSAIGESKTPKPKAPTFAITTRSGVGTRGPPFLTPSKPTPANTEEAVKKEGPEGAEPSITHNEEPALWPFIFYQPSKSLNLPFPSRVKKRKKDDEDDRLLSIFKQIHINLPFLEAMIHIPKGAKVLKDLLSHKEKLKKAAYSVKLSEECSAIIQRSVPPKEGDSGSLTLP
ncbi:hypothetical protein Tco_0050946, partial [Tanacetum coccineum]